MISHGDLIFSQIGTSENAISAVTEGFRGASVNHMGIVVINHKGTFVLEAFPPEVRVTQIEVFLRRTSDPLNGKKRFIVSRLVAPFQHLIPAAVTYGLNQRDVPYDALYLTNTSALYCSELIVDMFRFANHGNEFFEEKPMSFRDLVTGETHPSWVEYYAKFGMDVPEGLPGSNPGTISKDSRLKLIEVQGPPSGYNDT